MSARADEAAAERAPEVPDPHRVPLFYRFVYLLDRLFCGIWFRLRVEGLEHLPKEGGVLLAANHQSYLDILVIGAGIPRHVTFVARDTLAEWWWLAFTMRNCGAILIHRGTSDRAALRAMATILSAGGTVAIYPEGTRTRDGRLGTLKGGAVMAARLGKVPIVPVAIRGAYEAWPKGAMLPKPKKITVVLGPPIDATLDDARDRLEEAIRGMLGQRAPAPPTPVA